MMSAEGDRSQCHFARHKLKRSLPGASAVNISATNRLSDERRNVANIGKR
jgi:hypothetical protein